MTCIPCTCRTHLDQQLQATVVEAPHRHLQVGGRRLVQASQNPWENFPVNTP